MLCRSGGDYATVWVFPCGRWFDKGKDDGLLERDLHPVEDDEQVYTKRK